jgi:hypothetical protein
MSSNQSIGTAIPDGNSQSFSVIELGNAVVIPYHLQRIFHGKHDLTTTLSLRVQNLKKKKFY